MRLKKFWLSIRMALIVAVVLFDSGHAFSFAQTSSSQMEIALLSEQGFQSWKWTESNCDNCQIMMVPQSDDVSTIKVRRFIQALAVNKADLQKMLKVSGEEYTLLAHISVGILGRETRFGESVRYKFKESAPWIVSLAKLMRSLATDKEVSPNSRGLTQIKFLPQDVADKYGITPDNLDIPENAAIATMGYLINALKQLKIRIKTYHLDHITPDRYADYLPYIYFGRSKALIEKTAIPEQNNYVQALKKYMAMIQVFERQP
ncbi:hypothetical protein B9G69_006510 [Bdellovibrio sp. SKB1291214]|uniref:hypothetical protein n=1 Tax=Bdellovibrio sp. SKB1291214 TaxID=1732569 RepID=UPI000B515853|nr:hypothetical protein [Bdellovibrio sp. SKB1291214]UYL10229.1 hypothetical protein B9G69_006510 [Bdellovibrio sp. SKB1291214]